MDRKKPISFVQFVILGVIGVAVAATITTIAVTLANDPKRIATEKIEALAAIYYEDIMYKNMLNSGSYSGNPQKALERYTEKGFTPVSLQQLIILGKVAHTPTAEYLLEYCDEETTTVKFYPTSPYDRTSYRTEIHYSCNF